MRALVGPMLEGQKGDKAQQFLWGSLSETCLYAARRVPEISDHVADVDRAMRWGFGWELGPFELMDAIGVKAFAAQVRKRGTRFAAGDRKAAGERPKGILRIRKGSDHCFRHRERCCEACRRTRAAC